MKMGLILNKASSSAKSRRSLNLASSPSFVLTCVGLLIGVVLLVGYLHKALETMITEAGISEGEHLALVVHEVRNLYRSEVVDSLRSYKVETSSNYKDKGHSIPLPITFMQALGERLSEVMPGQSIRFFGEHAQLGAVDSEPMDLFEREAISHLKNNPKLPFYRTEDTEFGLLFRYATADVMDEQCAIYHNSHPSSSKTDWQAGDVRGVQASSVLLPAAVMESARELQIIIDLLIAIVALGGITLYVLLSRRARQAVVNERIATQHEQDMAENMELSKALALVNNQQRALDAHSLVSITDISGNIIYANDYFCKVSGYSREELLGQNHRLVKSDHHSPVFFHHMWRTISRGEIWSGDVKNFNKSGESYWVHATIVPFMDESGKTNKYVAVRTEITATKVAEQRALAATQAKSDFLANMSHEIRTPMAAIIGFAENLLEPDQTEAERVDAVHTIRRNGENLLAIINDILDLSKIEAGKMEVESLNCDLHLLLKDLFTLMQRPVEEKGLKLLMRCQGQLPASIQTDPVRLRQILVNVIGNAIKFTDQGEIQLVVSCYEQDQAIYLRLVVMDSGCGMDSEQSGKLFSPFTQADNTTTRKFGGTGLGLAISKRFAELLGGQISLIKTELGRGSTFQVDVATGLTVGDTLLDSASWNSQQTAATGLASNEMAKDLEGAHILVAEDGLDNQRLIRHVLKKAGAEVMVVDNGLLALEAALHAREKGEAFDCVLMDMQMPVMDGYEATRKLREQKYGEPIIALTAHAMASDRQKCLDAGCDAYQTKPVKRKELVALVSEYLVTKSRSLPPILCDDLH